MLAEQGDRSLEVGVARAAGAHPSVRDGGGAAKRVGVPASRPDRRMRLLHWLRRHGAGVELEDGAPVVHLRLGPQGLDELDSFTEAPHTMVAWHLELRVVLITAQADAEDRSAVARVVEWRDLVREVDGILDRQYDHRNADADRPGHRGRVGQHHHRVEREDVIERILGYPQVAKAERLG